MTHSVVHINGNCLDGAPASTMPLGLLCAAVAAHRGVYTWHTCMYGVIVIPVVCGVCGYVFIYLATAGAELLGWEAPTWVQLPLRGVAALLVISWPVAQLPEPGNLHGGCQ